MKNILYKINYRIIKKILWGILILCVLAGLYFFARLQIKYWNGIVATQQGLGDVIKFIRQEFPDKVTEYTLKQSQLLNNEVKQ